MMGNDFFLKNCKMQHSSTTDQSFTYIEEGIERSRQFSWNNYISILIQTVMTLILGYPIWCVFSRLLLAPVRGVSLKNSYIMLLGVLLVSAVIGSVKSDSISDGILVYLLKVYVIPYGAYTLFVYVTAIPELLLVEGIGVLLIMITLVALILCRKLPQRNRRKCVKRRLGECVIIILRMIFCYLVLVMISVISLKAYRTSTNYETDQYASEDLLSLYMEKDSELYSVFQPDLWITLDEEDKFEYLKRILAVEKKTLGFLEERNIEIRIEDMPVVNDVICQGQYDEKTDKIIIAKSVIEEGTAADALHVIFHEFWHGVEFSMVSHKEEYRNYFQFVGIYEKLPVYEYEMNHYVDGNDDFEAYVNQTVEKDAELYAQQQLSNFLRLQSQKDDVLK